MTTKIIKNKIFKLISFYFILFLFFSGILPVQFGFNTPCFGVCNQINTEFVFTFNIIFGLIVLFLILFTNFLLKQKNSESELSHFSIALIILIIGIISGFFLWDMELDDKWILYRISKNIFQNFIPTWNDGDLINVSTPLIWPYLSLYAHFFDDWKNAIKFAGIFFFALHIFLIMKAKLIDNLQKKILLLGTGLYLPYIFWSFSGLETSLATFWLFYTIVLFHKFGLNSSLAWFSYSAMILIRPESAVGLFVSLLILFCLNKKIDFRLIIISSIPILFWILYNLFLFGDLLPISAQIKSFFGSVISRPNNSFLVIGNASIHFISSILINIPITIAAIYTFFYIKKIFGNKIISDDFKKYVVLLSGIMSIIIYHLITGYIHMSYMFRYFSPFIIALFTINCFYNKDFIGFLKNSCNINVNKIITIILTLQISILVLSISHLKNQELSLTIAPLRDGFALNSYNLHMKAWMSTSDKFNKIINKNESIFSFNGNWIIGVARSGLYSIDGLFAPHRYSKFQNIKDCKTEKCLYNNFTYLVLQTYQENLKDKIINEGKYKVILEENSLIILKKITS